MTSASEGLIERNDGLDLFVALVDERELAVEQRHLRVECLKIGSGVAVLEEELRVVVGFLELLHLLFGQVGGLACRVVGIERVAHFLSGFEEGLFEIELCAFLRDLGDFVVALQFTLRKERLGERCNAGCDEFAGVHDHAAERVGELSLRTQGDFGEEGAAGRLNAVESLCQFGFADGDVGAIGEEGERQAGAEGFGEAFGGEGTALNAMGRLVEQEAEGVFGFAHALFDGGHVCAAI